MAKKGYKFDDSVISTIAKTLQVALLTGTDIVDNLRQIEVHRNNDGTLGVTQKYNNQFEHWMAKMIEEIEEHAEVQNHPQQAENSSEVSGLFE